MASRRVERRRYQRKSCTGKVAFDTFQEANIEATKMRLRAYNCMFCGKWHIGHGTGSNCKYFKEERGIHKGKETIAERERIKEFHKARQKEKNARIAAEAERAARGRDRRAAEKSYWHECQKWMKRETKKSNEQSNADNGRPHESSNGNSIDH